MTEIALIAPRRTRRQRRAVAALQRELIATAGGFSEYPGVGAWRGPNGRVLREKHTRFEVATDRPGKVLDAFKRYGARAGERALYYVRSGRPRPLAA
jgi:hypothetical protein